MGAFISGGRYPTFKKRHFSGNHVCICEPFSNRDGQHVVPEKQYKYTWYSRGELTPFNDIFSALHTSSITLLGGTICYGAKNCTKKH